MYFYNKEFSISLSIYRRTYKTTIRTPINYQEPKDKRRQGSVILFLYYLAYA